MENQTCHKKALRTAVQVVGCLNLGIAFCVMIIGTAIGVYEWTGSVVPAVAAAVGSFFLGFGALIYVIEYRDCAERHR